MLILATEDSIPGVMTSHTWKCRTYSRQELREACEKVGLHWNNPIYFTPFHRLLKIGGIIVEAVKTPQVNGDQQTHHERVMC